MADPLGFSGQTALVTLKAGIRRAGTFAVLSEREVTACFNGEFFEVVPISGREKRSGKTKEWARMLGSSDFNFQTLTTRPARKFGYDTNIY
jgi:hypothetical protein